MLDLKLDATIEHWPIKGDFRISRAVKKQASVIVATIIDGTTRGRGECVPYERYGETIDGVRKAILAMEGPLNVSRKREELLQKMPSGAARNAIDCALWDYESKHYGRNAMKFAGKYPLPPLMTAYTISLDTPDNMAKAASRHAHFPLLKLKLGGEGDEARLRAIRAAVPGVRLIADANEAWTVDMLRPMMRAAAAADLELIEQPLPAGEDEALQFVEHLVPICADESVHERMDLARLTSRYDAVNIKLDKAGGLTEALAMVKDAQNLKLKIMVGCMVGTSLAMAPALILAQDADWVDLDGPLLLEKDREPGLIFDGATILPPSSELWG